MPSPLPRVLVASAPFVLSLVPMAALGQGRLPPAGNYRGDQGLLAVSTLTEGGVSWVAGQVLSGFCAQEPGRLGLDGVIQGNQLVGRVLLCVKCARGGGAQEDRVVDFLATWMPEAEQFVGYVTLEPSCTTQGATAPDESVRVTFVRDALGAAPVKPVSPSTLQRKAAQEVEIAGRSTGDRARAALVRAVSFDPSSRNLARLGESLMAAGDVDGAQLALERASADREASWEAYLQLARLRVSQNALVAGRQAFEEAVKRRMPEALGKLNEAGFMPLREMPDYVVWVKELQRSELPK